MTISSSSDAAASVAASVAALAKRNAAASQAAQLHVLEAAAARCVYSHPCVRLLYSDSPSAHRAPHLRLSHIYSASGHAGKAVACGHVITFHEQADCAEHAAVAHRRLWQQRGVAVDEAATPHADGA